jgi:hypothetical protein
MKQLSYDCRRLGRSPCGDGLRRREAGEPAADGLSAQGVHKRSHEYAVVWRPGDGPTSSGRLELGDGDLVLHGSGGPDGLRNPVRRALIGGDRARSW